jgi:methyl-accepting chemotaxis protein
VAAGQEVERKQPTRRRSTAGGNGNGRRANGAAGGQEMTHEELEQLLHALEAARDGNFTLRLPAGGRGIAADLRRAFNELADRRESFSKEITRVGRVIGREGRLTERAHAPADSGHWVDTTKAINALIEDLVRPTTEVARVIDAVAQGDLSQKMQLTIEGRPVKGEFRRIGTTVNAMVDQLSSFADEVTRVAREVGTEGKLGGQAKVRGVSGV